GGDTRDGEGDDGKFASLAANFVLRGQGVWHANSAANAESGVQSFARPADSFLVSKGEAQPSTILPGPGESPSARSFHGRDEFADSEFRVRPAEALPASTSHHQPSQEDDDRALLEQIAERWDAELEAALLKAETFWKTEEAERLATAEAQWREKFGRALEEAQAETARNNSTELERDRLRGELAAVQSALVDREAALARAEMATEHANVRWRHEAQEALARAATAWKIEEAARFAAADSQWQERISKELSDARAQSEQERNRLHGESAALRSTIAEREAALARAEMAIEHTNARWRQEAQEALARAAASWKTEEAARFAAAEARWREVLSKELSEARAQAETARDLIHQQERNRLHGELAAVHSAIADREAALARAEMAIELTNERWRQAEATWKAEEAARFAAAEAQWREKSGHALSKAQAEETRNKDLELELDRLRGELASAQSALADREAALARTELQEMARFAAADAQWQEKFSKELSEARAQAGLYAQERDRLHREFSSLQSALADREAALARAEMAIEHANERSQQEAQQALSRAEAAWKAEEAARFAAAEAQWREKSGHAQSKAQAEETRSQELELELDRLRGELASVQAALVDRETAAAREWLAIERTREGRQREIQEVLSRAELSWKAEEANRLAAVEAEWRAATEKALIEAQAHMQPSHDQSMELELDRLREESAAMKAALADRETALAREFVAIERTRESAQREIEDALAKAKEAWKAEEAARLAAAEAQWRAQSSKALAELKARQDRSENTFGKESSRTALPATSTNQFRPREIVLKPDRIGFSSTARQDAETQGKNHTLRNFLVAILLATPAVAFYPRIASMFSESSANASATVNSTAPAAQEVTGRAAIVVRAANARTEPSATAAIVSALPAGLKLATVEQRGNWTLVRLAGLSSSKPGQIQAWVYSSSLSEPGRSDDKPSAGLHK
ncbi:MAG TPA: hypothetical protein VNH44_14990, partial [Micropepsaceae bacterium]|nr:hypothetical protein [Micropepsaceae bacterium]